MSIPNTSEKSVYLDREEHFHRGNVGGKTVVPFYYDANTDTLAPASQSGGSGTSATQTMSTGLALRYDEGATYTYIGEAAPGTTEASSTWRVKRLTNADNTVVWADGTAAFTKIWANRASLSYS